MSLLVRPQTAASPADDFPRYTCPRRVTSGTHSLQSASSIVAPTFVPGFTPVPWYHLPLRTVVLVSLPLFCLLGLYGTLILASANGTFKAVVALIESEEPKFPGTDDGLLMRYTQIGWLDKQLTILVASFAPIVDMNQGALSMFSIFGAGQLGAAWTLMVMESLRMGNRRRVVSFIGTFGLIFQNITYTVTLPIWLFIHLLTSPVSKPFPGTHANSVLLISAWDLCILPASITLSFVVPTILMALPSPTVVSSLSHQRFIALWQIFPLWTVMFHSILRTTLQTLSTNITFSRTPTKITTSSRSQKPLGATYLSNSKHIHRFILTLCLITHLPILTLSLIPQSVIPSKLPTFRAMSAQTALDVYIPCLPFPSHQVSSLAEGVHTFLIWDIYVGSFAFLLWGILLHRNATTEKAIVDPNTSLPIYRELLLGERIEDGMAWRKLAGKVVMWCFLAGPVGALAVLLWERDAIVRQKIKQGM